MRRRREIFAVWAMTAPCINIADTKESPMPSPSKPADPLHGFTLEMIVTALVEKHGWPAMAKKIPIRCFMFEPSVKSSLTFLRRTPWARKEVEDWFVQGRGAAMPVRTKRSA
jgi:uncharacterized protein (DUF2132 family)